MNTPNAYAPPKAAVADIDPANVGQVPAGRFMRLVASILDGIIVAAIVYLPMVVTGDLQASMNEVIRTGNSMAFYGGFAGTAGVVSLVGFLIWAVVTFRLVQRNGQTIAKKLVGIKVVRSDGSRASVARIFWLRNVVNMIIGLIPFYYFVDSLFIFGERRQCLHDKIADTIVVNA